MDITIMEYRARDAKFHYRLSYGVATNFYLPKCTLCYYLSDVYSFYKTYLKS